MSEPEFIDIARKLVIGDEEALEWMRAIQPATNDLPSR
jgi:hypothetical protein